MHWRVHFQTPCQPNSSYWHHHCVLISWPSFCSQGDHRLEEHLSKNRECLKMRRTKYFSTTSRHDFISISWEPTTPDSKTLSVAPHMRMAANGVSERYRRLCGRSIKGTCHVHSWRLIFACQLKYLVNGEGTYNWGVNHSIMRASAVIPLY